MFSKVIKDARRVLAIEAEGILGLRERLNFGFEQTVDLILKTSGKVITTGIGKSGIVARKIMATLNSTGTNAIFLHPVEAVHGDLGIVVKGDIVLALSYSGETVELLTLVPLIKERGAKLVAMTGRLKSGLGVSADIVIDCSVEREACPLNLVPTASTTAALAMGDALAVALINKRCFNAEDFRRYHPGGSLGRHLSLRVSEVMFTGKRIPIIQPQVSIRQAIEAIDQGELGTVLIVRRAVLKGIFTDGDIRRVVRKNINLDEISVAKVMTKEPKAVGLETLAVDALHLMEHEEITALPIVDDRRRVLGIVHLHDLLGRGRVSFQNLAYIGS